MSALLWRRFRLRRRLARIARALETMEELPRAVFERARFEGREYPEIAAELGISVADVEQQLAAALHHIMASIDGGGS